MPDCLDVGVPECQWVEYSRGNSARGMHTYGGVCVRVSWLSAPAVVRIILIKIIQTYFCCCYCCCCNFCSINIYLNDVTLLSTTSYSFTLQPALMSYV